MIGRGPLGERGEAAPAPPRWETICAQAREDVPCATRPLVAPIYQTAVWSLDSAEQCEAVYSGAIPGYIYSRDANPNHAALEAVIAQLESAAGAVVFGSGMAAVAAAATALSRSGGRVVAARHLYGATCRLLEQEIGRFGVATAWVDATEPEEVRTALAEGADLLLVETVANPLLQVADLPLLSDLCRAAGTPLVVDNTFAGPLACRPLEWGADLVLHSVTKFLGGHSDLTLGAAAGDSGLVEALRRQARLWGGAANPFESWLALRGIATLPLRMERAGANALALAERLEAHRAVRRVFYPGLPSHPHFPVARRQLASAGAMLTFETRGEAEARSVLAGLRRIRFAPSLGDAATTISYPVATSHRGIEPRELERAGINAAMLRLSVGIDHVEDIWADLAAALGGGQA